MDKAAEDEAWDRYIDDPDGATRRSVIEELFPSDEVIETEPDPERDVPSRIHELSEEEWEDWVEFGGMNLL